MNLKMIREELQRLSALVDGWRSSREITTLERDLALEKLRMLYDAVRFEDATATEMPEVTESEEPIVTEIPLSINFDEAFSVAMSLTTEPVAVEPAETEPIETEPVAAELVETEPISAEPVETEPVAAEPIEVEPAAVKPVAKSTSQPVAGSLFDDAELISHRHKQRVIMALYNTDAKTPAASPISQPISQPIDQPPVQPESPVVEDVPKAVEQQPSETAESGAFKKKPVVEFPRMEVNLSPNEEEDDDDFTFEEVTIAPKAVLGEVINHDRQTLSDTIAAPRDVATELRHRETITDLRRVIGINDKFLMINDLFDGDAEDYEQAINQFNSFDNLDDCMIYIAEHYIWNSNSDGAKLLMELLERKFA
ncbi:MAG: hypothetical protein RRY33_06495 [Alistipes sp.]